MAEALQIACATASSYLDLTLLDRALGQMRAVQEMVRAAPVGYADALVPVLAQVALRLVTVFGRDGETWLWNVCQDTLTSSVGRPAAEETLVTLWQLAKGLRLRAGLATPPRSSVSADPVAAGLLRDIEAAERAGAPQAGAEVVTPPGCSSTRCSSSRTRTCQPPPPGHSPRSGGPSTCTSRTGRSPRPTRGDRRR